MIDSHAHLSSPQLRDQVDELLQHAASAGLDYVINIATDPEELHSALILSKKYPWVPVVGATTPHDVEKEGEAAFSIFEQAALSGSLVAVGETGLDYFYEHAPRGLQQLFLRRYVELAKKAQLPLVIHCRNAFTDLFSLFDELYGKVWGKGVLHCFTGSLEEAKVLIDHGWMISLSGIITFKKSEALREVARFIPLEHLLIETDAPFLASHSHRGEQNEPAFLVETATLLADLKGVDLMTIVEATAHNAKALFKL